MALPIAEKIKSERSNLLIAFSLANLCFLNLWFLAEQMPTPALNYYRKRPPDPTLLIATLFDTALVSALIWYAWKLVQRSGRPLLRKFAQATFLVALSYPIEKLIEYLEGGADKLSYVGCTALIATETTLLMGVMLALFFNNLAIVRLAKSVTLVLALLFPSVLLDLAWTWMGSSSRVNFTDHPLGVTAGPVKSGPRVVWMVFDEMDQGLVFDRRPAGVHMPNFDRFRAESFYSSQARPSARWTMIALPSLITGRLLTRVEMRGSDDLDMWSDDNGPSVSWQGQPNLFRDVRRMGLNSGIVGWHHPYCRVLSDSLSYCHWQPSEQGAPEIETEFHCRRIGVVASMGYLLAWKIEDALSQLHLVEPGRVRRWQQESLRAGQKDQYGEIRSHALEAVADPRLDLVFIHWPTPHPFGIFNRTTGLVSTSAGNYLDNLELADRSLAEVRAAIEKAGLWDRTAILITADHPLRPEMWMEKIGWNKELRDAVGGQQTNTVPFVLKLPGRQPPAVYKNSFSAVLIHDVIEGVLRRDLKTDGDVSDWLNKNRIRYPIE